MSVPSDFIGELRIYSESKLPILSFYQQSVDIESELRGINYIHAKDNSAKYKGTQFKQEQDIAEIKAKDDLCIKDKCN